MRYGAKARAQHKPYLDEIRRAAKRRQIADLELRDAVIDALAAGVPKASIAEAGDLTRSQLYRDPDLQVAPATVERPGPPSGARRVRA